LENTFYFLKIMKSKSNIVLIVLLILNLSLLVYLLIPKMISIQPVRQSEIIYADNREAENLMISSFREEGSSINREALFKDPGGNVIPLTDLIRKEGKFFLFLPSSSCHSCLTSILQNIEHCWGKEELDQIVFYTSFQADEETDIVRKDYGLPVYTIGDNYLGFISEREQNYFMFYLTPGFEIKYFLTFNPDMKRLNTQYLKLCTQVFHEPNDK
jgi:hypothetical protein